MFKILKWLGWCSTCLFTRFGLCTHRLFVKLSLESQPGSGCPSIHDDIIKWKHFPHYWPFVWGIHWWLVNSLHKGQWRGALMFSLIFARINSWVNNGGAGDLRCHCAHYDITVMQWKSQWLNSVKLNWLEQTSENICINFSNIRWWMQLKLILTEVKDARILLLVTVWI